MMDMGIYFIDEDHSNYFFHMCIEYELQGDMERTALVYCLTSTRNLREHMHLTIKEISGKPCPIIKAAHDGIFTPTDQKMILLGQNLFNSKNNKICPYDLTTMETMYFDAAIQAMRLVRG